MRTNKNGVNKDQKDKVKKDGYNRGQHCVSVPYFRRSGAEISFTTHFFGKIQYIGIK